MRVITRRDRIRSAPKRWERQYRYYRKPDPKHEVTKQLLALDTETCDRSAVDQIVGNDSWTAIRCEECDTDVEGAVILGNADEYEIEICGPCLERALELLEAEEARPEA